MREGLSACIQLHALRQFTYTCSVGLAWTAAIARSGKLNHRCIVVANTRKARIGANDCEGIFSKPV